MQVFSSLDLQQRTGEVQRAVVREPVVVTSHGKPKTVMMSVEEFRRLKAIAGEPVSAEVLPRPRRAATVRGIDDPLGYDIGDVATAARRMAEDARTGRTRAAVAAELARVRRAFGGTGR
ncbi:type II toxin-antitoxin system Phd/YefM family antitoxin [Azospirillum sp. A39]|uniref:type II toxin-antitoxin system Phd/YefM family antitoxin n=1 Tax=Azospirillum sp. A39 TaxID=3462279 RepID=UPI004045DD00